MNTIIDRSQKGRHTRFLRSNNKVGEFVNKSESLKIWSVHISFGRLSSPLTLTSWYPDWMTTLESYSWSKRLSIQRSGYLFFTVTLFCFLLTKSIRTPKVKSLVLWILSLVALVVGSSSLASLMVLDSREHEQSVPLMERGQSGIPLGVLVVTRGRFCKKNIRVFRNHINVFNLLLL